MPTAPSRLFYWLLMPLTALAADPYGLTQRHDFHASQFPMDPPRGGFKKILTNHSFNLPIQVQGPPQRHLSTPDKRLFIAEQAGIIKVVRNGAVSTFLDIRSKVVCCSEYGFLGFAFHPNFQQNGFFYVRYSGAKLRSNESHSAVIERYKIKSSNPDQADPNSAKQIFRYWEARWNHNGGTIQFAPDDTLIVSLGDDANSAFAQRLDTPLGKILRIIPSTTSTANPPFTVPTDNPFYESGKTYHAGISGYVDSNGYRQEIYGIGFRNPFRVWVNPASRTPEVWVGDVGQGAKEEVSILNPHIDPTTKRFILQNHGWPCREGTKPGWGTCITTPKNTLVEPLTDFRGPGGASVIGGQIYRGKLAKNLIGKYLFTDFYWGKIWAAVVAGGKIASQQEIGVLTGVTSFGEDYAGELYMTVLRGQAGIYQLTAATSGPQLPAKLSQAQLFSNVSSLTPVPGLIEYSVNSPLWSDGAAKRRWIGVPKNSTTTTHIGFDETQPWTFPQGTLLVKNFAFGNRNIETRVLHKGQTGWFGYSYEWNTAGTDADLRSDGETKTINGRKWQFPGRGECFQCHTASAGFVLGVNTRQLNRTFPYSRATDNQLRSWNHIGLFESDVQSESAMNRLAFSQEFESYATAAVNSNTGRAARSYLASNCAHCHQPGTGTPGQLDFRYDTDLQTTGLLTAPLWDMGIPGARIVTPGSTAKSILYQRMIHTGPARMPKLGSFVVDPFVTNLMQTWINSDVERAYRQSLGRGCGPATAKVRLSSTPPVMGGSATLSLRQLPPGSVGQIWVSAATRKRARLTLPGASCRLGIDLATANPFWNFRADASGKWTGVANIPANLVPVGTLLHVQAAGVDSNGALHVSNGLRLVLGK